MDTASSLISGGSGIFSSPEAIARDLQTNFYIFLSLGPDLNLTKLYFPFFRLFAGSSLFGGNGWLIMFEDLTQSFLYLALSLSCSCLQSIMKCFTSNWNNAVFRTIRAAREPWLSLCPPKFGFFFFFIFQLKKVYVYYGFSDIM